MSTQNQNQQGHQQYAGNGNRTNDSERNPQENQRNQDPTRRSNRREEEE
jgi:hypothetical protein